ncbi:MAG: acyltransferase family protein [Paracoccaceae bacterium]
MTLPPDAPQTPPQTAPQTAPRPGLAYRPEIDGLRAIAVGAVVLYHFGLAGLSGGFVGVDIFFVISGYLIGGILWAELGATGRLSFRRFYERRLRRLAPAYLAVALTSLVVGWLVLLPFEFREFGKELVAATLWFSNIFYWREAGYFDIGAEHRVLLHTWSLSVEEQFYLVLPATLWLMLRLLGRPGAVMAALTLLWAVSAALCLWASRADPTAAFYLFPFRAWELLSGVLLAIAGQQWPHRTRPASPRAAAALAWAGLALLALALGFVQSAGFPGWQAALPVAGTGLLLAATGSGGGGLVARALRLPPVRFVGLISYSLYLWHWPVLVLSREWRGPQAAHGLLAEAGWIALTLALAALSWRFVEQPVRQGRFWRGWRVFVPAGLALGAVAGAGVGLWKAEGLPGRFDPAVRAYVEASGDFLQDWSRCTTLAEGPLAGLEGCAIGPEGPPRVLIWGDSHLRALMDGLAEAGTRTGVAGLILWRAGCPPVFGLEKDETAATAPQNRACGAANRQIRAALPALKAAGVERILLVGRWSYYAEGAGIGLDGQNRIALAPGPDGDAAIGAAPDAAGRMAAALDLTLAEMGAVFGPANLWLFRQPPELPAFDSRTLAAALAHGRIDEAGAAARGRVSAADLSARVARAEAPLRALAAAGALRLIDPWPWLCAPDGGSCGAFGRDPAAGPGPRVLYFDTNHLTNAAARMLAAAGLFDAALAGSAASQAAGAASEAAGDGDG